MARKAPVRPPKKQEPEKPLYKSATCGIASAAAKLNEFHTEGYELVTSFAIVAVDPEKNEHVQAIYILVKRVS
jgi:hypothetical protein